MNNNSKKNNLYWLLEKVKNFKGQFKIDSRDIEPGDIFITLRGNKDHGENYIKNALQRNAMYVITEKNIKNKKNRILNVENCTEALELIAKYKRSIYKGNIIGITGSVGKTSTKEQIAYFLKPRLKTYHSPKSYNNLLGVSLTLANLDLNASVSIFEIGTSNFGEIAKLTNLVKPHIAILTNIGATHLENLKSIRNVEKEKSDIFNSKYNSQIHYIIIPYKNRSILKKINNKNKYKIYTFGVEKSADAYLKKILSSEKNKIHVETIIMNNKVEFELPSNGKHQILNCLISLLVFHIFNVNFRTFIKLSPFLPKLSGRGKIYKIRFNNKTINLIDESYNASPLSMKATIIYFSDLIIDRKNKKFLILGDMLELGSKTRLFHTEILKYLKVNLFYQVIICGEYIKVLYKSIKNKKNVYYFSKIEFLNNHLLKYIENEDIVLTKCSNATMVNQYVQRIKKNKFQGMVS